MVQIVLLLGIDVFASDVIKNHNGKMALKLAERLHNQTKEDVLVQESSTEKKPLFGQPYHQKTQHFISVNPYGEVLSGKKTVVTKEKTLPNGDVEKKYIIKDKNGKSLRQGNIKTITGSDGQQKLLEAKYKTITNIDTQNYSIHEKKSRSYGEERTNGVVTSSYSKLNNKETVKIDHISGEGVLTKQRGLRKTETPVHLRMPPRQEADCGTQGADALCTVTVK